MVRARGLCRLTAPLFGLLVATSHLAAEVRTIAIGEEGDLTWQGQGTAPVEAILPALTRSRDDPNDLVQGNTPGNLLELDSDRGPGSMHLVEVVPGENVASTALSRGGYINAPNVFAESEGFGFAGGSACIDRGDAVGGKQLLGFGLGQQGPPRCSRLFEDFSSTTAVGHAFVIFRQDGRFIRELYTKVPKNT